MDYTSATAGTFSISSVSGANVGDYLLIVTENGSATSATLYSAPKPQPTVTTAYYAAYITAVSGTSVTVNYAAAEGITEATDPRTYIGQMTSNGTFNLSYQNLKAGDYLIIQVALTDGMLSADAVVKNYVPTTTDTTPVDLSGNYAAYLIQTSGDELFIGYAPTALTDTNADLTALKEQMIQVDGFAYCHCLHPPGFWRSGRNREVRPETGKNGYQSGTTAPLIFLSQVGIVKRKRRKNYERNLFRPALPH